MKKEEKKEEKKVNFFVDMLRGANGGISSKRVLGGFILIVLLFVIAICSIMEIETSWLGEAFITMEIGAFSLLGIGLLEKKTNKKQIRHYGDDCDETEKGE